MRALSFVEEGGPAPVTSHRPISRRTPWIGVVLLAAPLVVLAPVGADPAPPFDTMPDGSWMGSLIYNGDVSFPSAQAQASATGTFDFVVAGGIVTEGTMQFTASGLGTADVGAIAALDLVGQGGAEGTASEPVLRPDSVHITGVGQSQGIEVPIDIQFGPVELTVLPLQIFTVTCEQVTGDFVQTVAAAVAGAGGTGTFFGRWVALRGDDPANAGTMAAWEQLISDTEKIVNLAKSGGTLDPIALLETLDRAEQLAASLSINTSCRNLQPEFADTFSLSISVLISDLIEAALTAPESFNVKALQAVVAVGVRSGVLSVSAPPGSNAENLSIQLQAVFETRLMAAVGPPIDTDDVTQILLTSLSMGWTSTAEKAKAAL